MRVAVSALILCFIVCSSGFAIRIQTNQILMPNAPKWLSYSRVDSVTQSVQGYLEWDIRRIKVYWYSDASSFMKSHGRGPRVEAYFRPRDSTIHLGHKVNKKNFDQIFGHELVHAILFQKYKGAVPKWLEEGLANYVAKKGTVNYPWLAKQPKRDVTKMVHPYKGVSSPKYHYQASRALIEMIASKCALSDLLQLSVGKKMETYLSTFCEIKDINQAFVSWLDKKKKQALPKKKVSKKPSKDEQPKKAKKWWEKPRKKYWWE